MYNLAHLFEDTLCLTVLAVSVPVVVYHHVDLAGIWGHAVSKWPSHFPAGDGSLRASRW
jgi:hypothetical protein